MNNNHLVISALGHDGPGIVDAVSSQIFDCACNIEDSRMTVLGQEFALILMVSGRWDSVAKLEAAMDALSNKLDLTIQHRRTEPRKLSGDQLPYSIEISSMDQAGIVQNLSRFLSKRDINIEDMSTAQYAAPHTGTPMFAVNVEIGVPTATQISTLREDFLDFCDQLNLDAVLEPSKA